MTPDRRTDNEIIEERYPDAALKCRYLTKWRGEFAPYCQIDREHRTCEGKCGYYKSIMRSNIEMYCQIVGVVALGIIAFTVLGIIALAAACGG